MKSKTIFLLFLVIILSACSNKQNEAAFENGQEITLEKSLVKDKIMGAWAGQVIGCTYGGPTEFRFNGTMIPDDHFIPWYDGIFKWWYDNAPGLYDDIYMDLTFVDVFEKEGLDAPVTSFAHAFANADYQLWHANQAARYNILNGIMPPESGHWKYNPHADDIDFQIEADFAGIMAPGMINTASEICDRIGHIMNYGDGWYGGVYVAAMYSLAFISDDVEFVVKEGLKSIPAESSFYQLMADVINWYEEYPTDWKMNWFLTQKKWASEVGCPDGVFSDFNIDAKINAAYIIIGLLYGNGDYEETIRISTLCGQDSDCNPASSGGILGTILGYKNIPSEWKIGLSDVEDENFRYTDISLNKAYDYSFRQALEIIKRYGGVETGENITIKYQTPQPVKLEQSFTGHYPAEFKDHYYKFTKMDSDFNFSFSGNGFVVRGGCSNNADKAYEGRLETYIDGKLFETAVIPADFRKRRHDLTWAYELEPGNHSVEIKILNPLEGSEITVNKIIIYTPEKEVRREPTISIK